MYIGDDGRTKSLKAKKRMNFHVEVKEKKEEGKKEKYHLPT